MKHTLTFILTLCIALSLLAIGAGAESDDAVKAKVTVSVKGELVVTQETVTVFDADGDGALTVCDALYCAHQALYQGGAAAGFTSYQSDYGLSMSKLWGDESGAYGYYLNNTSCMSLADPVKEGDLITAFVYASTDWSDVYTYFDISEAVAAPGEQLVLTLMAAGYDQNWNPITYPVEGATVTVDGQATSAVTDASGKVTLTPEAGEHTVSATHSGMTLVPPVCKVTVNAPEAETSAEQSGCKAMVSIGLLAALIPLACVCIKHKEK